MEKRNKLLIEDDRWKKKGGAYVYTSPQPVICPYCKGYGVDIGAELDDNQCRYCDGMGTIYE